MKKTRICRIVSCIDLLGLWSYHIAPNRIIEGISAFVATICLIAAWNIFGEIIQKLN